MIDLHMHTTNSDGDYTPREILMEAGSKGLDIISITDHNSVSAYKELKDLDIKSIYSGNIITGTELEFTRNGRLFDMLGYGIDVDKVQETEIIKRGMVHTTIEAETEILNKLKAICDKLNIKYTKGLAIKTAHNMANDVLLDDIIQYEENKGVLDSMHIFDRSSFYRGHFCEPSSPFYIKQTDGKFEAEYTSKVIRDAGGKAFLAHPFVYKLPNLKEFLDELISLGLIDGIECFHRKHTKEQIEWLISYCDEHHLLKSGGSDKHTSKHYMGHASNNEITIPNELVADWINDCLSKNTENNLKV